MLLVILVSQPTHQIIRGDRKLEFACPRLQLGLLHRLPTPLPNQPIEIVNGVTHVVRARPGFRQTVELCAECILPWRSVHREPRGGEDDVLLMHGFVV